MGVCFEPGRRVGLVEGDGLKSSDGGGFVPFGDVERVG